MSLDRKKITAILLLVLVAVISFTKLADYASDPNHHEHSIETMDENISTVLKLSAGAAAASVTLTLLPSDVGTPVADQLADLSKYFLLLLSAIYLEKYLVTITGWIAFKILVPAACALIIGHVCTKKESLLRISGKVMIFAFAICAAIPTSVKISDVIYQTYETSMESTIDELENLDEDADEDADDEDVGLLDMITGAVTNAVVGVADKATEAFTNLLEAMAVMLVTTCLIPILVFVFYAWLLKTLFNNQSIRIDDTVIKKITARIQGE